MEKLTERMKIEQMVYEKIKSFEKKKEKNESEIEKEKRFKKIYELLNNQYEFLFEDIDMELAITILTDLGMTRKEAIKSYSNLIKESMNSKYILMDINNGEEER